MNELNLLMIQIKDQWWSNSNSSAWPYHLGSQAVVVPGPFFTPSLGCQTVMDHFLCLPGHTSKRWRVLYCLLHPSIGIKGQKNKGIEHMVGGNPGLEQDQPVFAVCLPYPGLPCTLHHHVQLVSLLPSAITFLLGSQQLDEMRITLLFISVVFFLERLTIPSNKHFSSQQKSYPYCRPSSDLQVSKQ